MTSYERDAALLGAKRLTDVMSRVPVDLNEVLRPENAKAVIRAASECTCCTRDDVCENWIAANEDGGETTAPDFCPNAEFVKSCRPKSC